MTITALMENTAKDKSLASEHGLSLYIVTESHGSIFDFGESGKFADNAKKLGLDVGAADIAMLSHGHFDHGGGMKRFFEENSAAPVYVHKTAFTEHLARRDDGSFENIGIDPSLLDSGRLILTGNLTEIDGGLTLFSHVTGTELVSQTNGVLLEMGADGPVKDSFSHEQNLLISENGRLVLISGCAHRGIINVMEKAAELCGRAPDVAIGGFHLSNPGGSSENMYIPVAETAERLMKYPTKYYTCHCTGLESFAAMKRLMGDRIDYFSGGMTLEI